MSVPCWPGKNRGSFNDLWFFIYKLLQQRIEQTGTHPVLDIIIPKTIRLIMISSAFICLSLAIVRFIQVSKKVWTIEFENIYEPGNVTIIHNTASFCSTGYRSTHRKLILRFLLIYLHRDCSVFGLQIVLQK